jgi:hypothetical protein
MTHRTLWVLIGLALASLVAWRRAAKDRQRRAAQIAERKDEDREGAWAPLVRLRENEQLFRRFRSAIRERVEIDVLDLFPEDEVGDVAETGRALCRLIDHLEGEFDCALPPGKVTERLSLEEWFRVVVRNAAHRTE